ncbi:hypothetical protein [Shinella sp. G-2]|uniref:hypothetical protein n=1 Tax=Shinella sp. G-2 TaxID=3133141 RepID=UPI003D07A68E
MKGSGLFEDGADFLHGRPASGLFSVVLLRTFPGLFRLYLRLVRGLDLFRLVGRLLPGARQGQGAFLRQVGGAGKNEDGGEEGEAAKRGDEASPG